MSFAERASEESVLALAEGSGGLRNGPVVIMGAPDLVEFAEAYVHQLRGAHGHLMPPEPSLSRAEVAGADSVLGSL